jgi:hypothetical protein
MTRRFSICALVLCAGALSACGGSSDKDKITSLIKTVGKNPSSLCDTYATASLLQQAGGKAICDRAAKAPGAKDPNVKINSVSVNGSNATAKVTSENGPDKGRVTTITFVKQGGDWKVSNTS